MFSVMMIKVISSVMHIEQLTVGWHKFCVRFGCRWVRLHECGAAGQRQEVPRLHSTLTQPTRQVY